MKSTNSYIETDLGNIAPNPRGQYNKEVIYEYLDLVSYQGGSYLCRADEDQTVGIDPVPGQTTEVWQMVALPGNATEEYVEKHTDVIEKAKEVETNRAAVELCQQEIEAAQLDVEQMRKDTQQSAQSANDANTEAQQAAQQAEASRSAAQMSEQNAAASRDLANTYKEAAETAKSAAETAAQNASESKTAAETAAQNAAQSKADIDSIKAGIEEAAKGENVLQIQKNMNDIDSLKEDISNKITKLYASNQGETHLADSDNGKIMDMMLYGKSEQKQYSGKNLLELSDNQVQSENLKIQINQGIITFSGTVNAETFIKEIDSFIVPSDGTYTISTNSNSNNDSPRILFLINDNPQYESAFNGATKELNAGDVVRLHIRISSAGSYDGVTIKPMIEKGSKVTSYEPYTGGIPSPSLDYPQEIKRVVNPVVKVCGKNLLQPNLRYNDKVKINIKKGAKLTLIFKNGAASKGGNLKFEKANGELKWLEIDKGSAKRQIMLDSDVVAYTYLFNSETSENYALYIGDENTYEPYKEQSMQLHITLNAIPVSSNGNVTIDGQQYVADRVVEKDGIFGIERNIREIHTNTKTMNNSDEYPGWNKVEGISDAIYYSDQLQVDSRKVTYISNFTNTSFLQNNKGTNNILYFLKRSIGYSQSELIAKAIEIDMYIRLQNTIFEPLPGDIQAKLRTFVTNYPVTNISVTSDQLDGYIVFNYPISVANGWNYVKQQLNDNRNYIYDMDLQSAEAYVNSEYAVALTELEV